jgi:hypothetical protein
VNNAEIKIVGAVTDENSLEEIENIAKVFAYEQRMKDYTSLLRKPNQTKKTLNPEEKKPIQNLRYTEGFQQHIPVKGLC